MIAPLMRLGLCVLMTSFPRFECKALWVPMRPGCRVRVHSNDNREPFRTLFCMPGLYVQGSDRIKVLCTPVCLPRL